MKLGETRPGTPADWLTQAERSYLTKKEYGQGLFLVVVHFALYFATMALAVAQLPLALNIIGSFGNGLAIGLIFIIGHDACHGSFVPGKLGNQILARLTFLPPAHSASLWNIVHNRIHHGRTNLKGYDYVWAPMTKAEYDAASPFRRAVERVYRSAWGSFVYYYFSFWLTKTLIPISPESRADWKRHVPDSIFVLTGLALTIAGVGALGHWLAPARPLWLTLVLGWVIPYAFWNFLVALTIYLQHTHPAVPWFKDEASWSHFNGNVRGTTHVDLPIQVAPLFNMVYEHTAHHALPSVPIYKLPKAQKLLRARYSTDMTTYMLTLKNYLEITRVCKLFDFERMCWTDFDGVPTSDPMPVFTGREAQPVRPEPESEAIVA